jgi:hypothetical protein
MRFRSFMAAGALVLIPVLALAAGQAANQSDASPMLVSVNGQTVPVKAETRVIQTANGPMKVSTWSWHSPQGGSSFEMQSSTGGAPSPAALRQMQAMQDQMRVMQANMMRMQQRMFEMQRAAFAGFNMPVPQNIAMPFWGTPPVVVVPVQRAVPSAAPAQAPAPAPIQAHGPELKA